MDRQGRLEPRRGCLGNISTSVADADFRSRTRTHGTPNNPLLRVGDKGHRRSCCSHMADCKGNLCHGSEGRPSLGSHIKGSALVRACCPIAQSCVAFGRANCSCWLVLKVTTWLLVPSSWPKKNGAQTERTQSYRPCETNIDSPKRNAPTTIIRAPA